ncbi:YncE family protein [Mycobacterium intracellulare]|uniref:YncE family protein n=1 Tax=Mycobacterium intracellulare TaxID=1767 RepID=UPI0015CD5C1E|nr:YncE family protein [Mycobacterium intracellulare]MCA2328235.1 YncE family protein [Mycobacterium intracellulare]UQB86422.1 YncE family protein [Mycobacterium intracellulare]
MRRRHLATRADEHSKGGTSVSDAYDPTAAGFSVDDTAVVRVPVHHGPISDMDLSGDGRRLLVTNYARDAVTVIDAHTLRVSSTLAGLCEPSAVAMSSADANYAYVSTATAAYDAIEVIDVVTNWRIATHRVAHSVSDLTVSADGKHLYASRNAVRGADVTVLDTTTGELEVIELATAPGTTTACVRASADGRRLYVGVNGPNGGSLAVVETRTRSDGGRVGGRSRVVGTIELGLPVRDVALSSDGATAYVASCGPVVGSVLDVIDTRANKLVKTHKINEITGPLARMTLSRDGERAYLVSDDRVTVLGTRALDVLGEVTVTKNPSCVLESPDGSHLYVADYSGVLTAARIDSGQTPHSGDADHPDATAGWLFDVPQWEPALA